MRSAKFTDNESMSSLAVDYSYRYAFLSSLVASGGRSGLRLATSGGPDPHPYFFQGRLLYPRRTADLLRGLMQVVHSRFHVPAASLSRILALADPVITSSNDRLRFEGFSACASAYARVDLLPAAIEGEYFGRGTTNVDFNAPMLAALAKVRDGDEVALSVGTDEVSLERNGKAFLEKKVSLPVRWLKGFAEVQSYQARMKLIHDVSGADALRFLRSLPRTKTRHPTWLVPFGRGLRSSQQPSSIGVRVGGIERLRVLEGLAPIAKRLRVYGDRSTETSAWEIVLDEARFHLVLSPENWRGFSGEGQALMTLGDGKWQSTLPKVRAALRWDVVIDAGQLAKRIRMSDADIHRTLIALGSRGLVGFDLAEGAYFHRELPFDLSLVEALQPRLKAALKLFEESKVLIHLQTDQLVELFVGGGEVEHRVAVAPTSVKCTCPWYSKYQGQRGVCKHILAAEMLLERGDT